MLGDLAERIVNRFLDGIFFSRAGFGEDDFGAATEAVVDEPRDAAHRVALGDEFADAVVGHFRAVAECVDACDGAAKCVGNALRCVAQHVGLFADIAEGGIVRNLHVTGTIKGGWHVGSIASVNHGTIENSYFDGTVEGVVNATTGGQNVGGLVGLNIGGSVRNCYNTGTITGQSMIGGIAGWNDASVTYCYNTGIIEGTGDYIGGIAGINTGSIQRSVSLGAASAKSSGITAISGIGRVAGTADYSGDTGSLAVCYANKTMKVNGSNVTVQVAANARNGADITSTEWSDPAWWTGTTGVRWNSYGDTNWDFSGIGASSYPKLTVFQ